MSVMSYEQSGTNQPYGWGGKDRGERGSACDVRIKRCLRHVTCDILIFKLSDFELIFSKTNRQNIRIILLFMDLSQIIVYIEHWFFQELYVIDYIKSKYILGDLFYLFGTGILK